MLADVEQVVEVVEAGLDGGGDGDRLGVGEVAEVAARAADDAGQQADVGRRQAGRLRRLPDFVEVGLADVGEDDVLLVRDAQFAEAVAVGEFGDAFHLLGGDVAGRDAVRLQRQRDGGVARHLVRVRVAVDPAGEGLFAVPVLLEAEVDGRQVVVVGGAEVRGDALEFGLREGRRAVREVRPLGLDLAGEFLDAERLDEDLDARLVDVVAAAEAVVDAQDGLGVGEEVLPGQELAHHLAADRGAPEAAADDHAEARSRRPAF